MFQDINRCVLTGYTLNPQHQAQNHAMLVTYRHEATGFVKITYSQYQMYAGKNDVRHPVLAGICREAFENNEEPPIINTDFLTTGIQQMDVPTTPRARAIHLLKYMYKKGGKEWTRFEFKSPRDYPLVYATNEIEFIGIMARLQELGLIKVNTPYEISHGRWIYEDVLLTEEGIAEAEKELPAQPMLGLVVQEIATGDRETDRRIIHAKHTFFDDPISSEKMRSACIELATVLEPLRGEYEKLFGKPDTQTFFQMVNGFDIRHNNDRISRLEHPEQFEWIFYTLLNSITTYTKLKKRLSESA